MEDRSPDLFNDDKYFTELNRRHQLVHGRPLDRAELLKPRPKKWKDNFSAPVFFQNPPAKDQ
jgi:hypothetical protein